MDGLIEHEVPQSNLPTMLVAFAGWPDAAEAATRAMRFLVRKLRARKFAEIDPENFYDFTHVRPHSRVNRRGERVTRWPQNDFYHYSPDDESRALLLFVGTEPNLKWRTYSNILTTIAERHEVKLIVSLGALLDAVPHTREPRVTGRASSIELTQKAECSASRTPDIRGLPASTPLSPMPARSLNWSRQASGVTAPTTSTHPPDPKVSHALLTRLRSLIDIDVDLEELYIAGNAYQEEVDKVIAKQPDVSSYVRRLERRYDEARTATEEIPSPETMVEELENFLRSQSPGSEDSDA